MFAATARRQPGGRCCCECLVCSWHAAPPKSLATGTRTCRHYRSLTTACSPRRHCRSYRMRWGPFPEGTLHHPRSIPVSSSENRNPWSRRGSAHLGATRRRRERRAPPAYFPCRECRRRRSARPSRSRLLAWSRPLHPLRRRRRRLPRQENHCRCPRRAGGYSRKRRAHKRPPRLRRGRAGGRHARGSARSSLTERLGSRRSGSTRRAPAPSVRPSTESGA